MKISQIVESSTTSGAIGPVTMGTGPMQRRAGGSMFKGKKTKKPFYEENISEEDLIIIPGQGMKRRTGFIAHDPDRAEREGETLKNSLHTIIRVATHLNDQLSSQDDFPEWVSEKIGAIKSMMTGVMDYLISDKEMHGKISATEMTGGVVAGGVAFENTLSEKALSKKQQRFMGMVHAAQKGEKPASKEVGKVAKTMTKKAAKDFAQTKHKGLPEKVKKSK